MKIFHVLFFGTLNAMVLVPGAFAQNHALLSDLFSFGPNGDGSLRPGDRTYVTATSFQRGLAYNPISQNIIFVDRAANANTANPNFTGAIYVLGGITGADVATLNAAGISGGTFADFAVAVADDGVIYVGNLVNDGTAGPFKLYRWDSESSGNAPTVAYSGDPGNGTAQRWGDTMDIRGSGAGTQIILGTRPASTNQGTKVAILTTVDGMNFTATTLSTDVGDSASAGGIAFGSGDTFWAKNLDVPLRQFSFNLGGGTATTLHSFGPDVLAVSRNLEPLAVDAANNLLAIVDMTSGVDHVRLYDIANLSQPPVLLDIRDFPVNNANGTTTKGYLDFGGGYLYVHNMNNGLLTFIVDSGPFAPPVFNTHPASQRVLTGRTVKFEVLAYVATSYQWQRNGVNIPGATGAVLTITNVQTADAGNYRVIASNVAGSTFSSEAVLSVVNLSDLFHLSPLWSAAPAAQPYVTSGGGANTPNERFFAYNALSNQVLVVQRSGNNYTVHVVDGSTGTKLYNLKTNGITLVVASEVSGANGIGLVAIDVADDGAIYACNASPNAGGGSNPFAANKLFRVYRWASSDSNTLPVEIFTGDPAAQASNFRWGDVLDARGSGLNTQVLLDNQNASARYMAILRPTDGTMSAFSSTFFFQDTTTPFGTSIGRSLEFGTGDTLWQKRKAAPLLKSSFDLNAIPNISPLLASYSNFPSGLGLVGLDLSRNIAAGINFVSVTTTPDTLDLYDISDPTIPLLLAQYNFPVNHIANNNFIGRVLFSGNKVFALDGNNGLLAFTIVSGPVSPPTILSQPQNARVVAGGNATISVVTADIASFQWQFNSNNVAGATNSSYAIVSAQSSNAGSYRVIVSNDAGSVTSSNATLTVLPAEDFHHLSALWSLAPLSRPYLRTDTDAAGQTPRYRGIAYNSLSNQVYIVARTGQTTGLTIQVLDATTGDDLYQLNTAGISGGTIILLAMGVAEDGALYAANMDTSATTGVAVYKLYRWPNSSPDTVPVLVFSGEPAGLSTPLRWGDTMAVRGSGTGTEILIDANSGTLAAVLKPTDETMATFTSTSFSQSYGGGSIGRSLEFGTETRFWQKRKGAQLLLSSYDLSMQTSIVETNYPNFPASLGPVALDLPRNLVVGINFSSSTNFPDTLDLFDIADFNNPLLIAQYPFPINSRPNGNFIGQLLFAGNRVFAVDGNNGVAAFTIVPPSGPVLSIVRSGSDVLLKWPVSATGFGLQKTLTLSPPDWMDVSQMPVEMDGQNTVTENASSGNAFYRLRKPQ